MSVSWGILQPASGHSKPLALLKWTREGWKMWNHQIKHESHFEESIKAWLPYFNTFMVIHELEEQKDGETKLLNIFWRVNIALWNLSQPVLHNFLKKHYFFYLHSHYKHFGRAFAPKCCSACRHRCHSGKYFQQLVYSYGLFNSAVMLVALLRPWLKRRVPKMKGRNRSTTGNVFLLFDFETNHNFCSLFCSSSTVQ